MVAYLPQNHVASTDFSKAIMVINNLCLFGVRTIIVKESQWA